MTPLIVLLCGMPFAGKTSLARRLRDELAFNVISLDQINADRGIGCAGEGLSDEVWQDAHRIAVDSLSELLASGAQRIVVDDTCCLRFLRDDYRRIGATHDARTRLLVLDVDRTELLRRLGENRRNPRRNDVTDEVFEKTGRIFEWPGEDEHAEVTHGVDPAMDVVRRALDQAS